MAARRPGACLVSARRSCPARADHALRTRRGLVGHRQVPGPPGQGLAPPGDVIIGQEPAGKLVGRTEETVARFEIGLRYVHDDAGASFDGPGGDQ